MLQWLERWFIGGDGRMRGPGPDAQQVRRSSPTILALVVLFCMAVLGVAALFIAAWMIKPADVFDDRIHFNARFLAFGMLAGSVGAAAGGLLGLLFGLPTSAARAAAQSNAIRVAAQNADAADSPVQDNPWFNDNTAMEQIADWLTKIIVGLSLANFQTFLLYGWQVSIETSKAMTGLSAPGPSIGGLTLAPAVLIGFLISYIWIRRYLPGELANARLDMIERQRESRIVAGGLSVIRAADASGDKQEPPTNPSQTKTLAAKAVEAIPKVAEDWPPVAPGSFYDDPWKGQFTSRHAGQASATLQATVSAVPGDKDWFAVTIRVTQVNDSTPLAGRRARLYLHSTFPRPIREITFSKSGTYLLKLVAWGAFTVGLQLDNGELYELDLAELPDAPELFRSR